MKQMIIMPPRRRASLVAQLLALLAMTAFTTASFSQSHLSPPSGDGWQMLGAPSAPAAPAASLAMVGPAAAHATSSHASLPPAPASIAVTPVVLPGAPAPAPASAPSFAITPQDINLRNALDRWLQQQGWQLAWKIDDDLPLEFNATFSGDFDSVLTQVMRATNHMRTPTRICEHTNNVIRVVARAANCQD
ncbi:toxin co-regulated pilus biosynthesis Q family protein [Paraburkholderia diazotrophica]|uniref:Toxin co-regulated pilus biosynthesis protein Q n=1 Tax=Paraburkholderia diazotrophica TaxID=667676 RepID=A0A1H7EDT9_9BURK|nr:toxin co-regulated pilus biosynthesis Q family protein [Paraburkholderia diazotrophica]SEK10242.1 Toxin co-regulated pilus biosynthesis protein Q [Paraburkholderia diazotrophica]